MIAWHRTVTPPVGGLSFRRLLLACLGLALLVGAVYANALDGSFQYDDRETIVDNPGLRAVGFDGATLQSWLGRGASAIGGGHYRPVTFATYALNYAIGGLDPAGYHIVNVVIHWATAASLMVLVWMLLPRVIPAIVAGGMAAVSPFNSEAVNYIAARSSLLVAWFAVLGVIAFIVCRRCQADGRRRAAAGAAVLAVCALVLGLASKETAVTIPMLWLCYDLGWSRRLPVRTLLAPYVIGGALLAGYLGWTRYDALIAGVLTGRAEMPRPFWTNVWTQISVIPHAIGLYVWPAGLSAFHDIDVLSSPGHHAVLGGLLAVGSMSGIGARWLLTSERDRRTAGLFLLWFPLTLAPIVLYPLVVVFQEHRGYLPGLGLSALAGITAGWVTDRVAARPALRRVAWTSLALAAGVLAGLTIQRNTVWHDPRSLWTDAVAHAPRSTTGRINLGAAFFDRGELDRAEVEFLAVLALDPRYPLAYYNLGLLALRREQYDQARAWLLQTIALAPRSWEGYDALGDLALKQGDRESAASAFRRAIELNPRDAKARAKLGLLAQQAGDEASAERFYQTALQDDPEHPEVLNNLGTIYSQRGEWARALVLFTAATDRDPEYLEAGYNQALALDALGRRDEARARLETVLRRLPPDPRSEPRRRAVEAILDGWR